MTLTVAQAIAIVAATTAVTIATYDICVNQGYCDQLARDLEQALNHRQATGGNPPGHPRDTDLLPVIPALGAACAANTELTHEGATQAIQAAEARLVQTEGMA